MFTVVPRFEGEEYDCAEGPVEVKRVASCAERDIVAIELCYSMSHVWLLASVGH